MGRVIVNSRMSLQTNLFLGFDYQGYLQKKHFADNIIEGKTEALRRYKLDRFKLDSLSIDVANEADLPRRQSPPSNQELSHLQQQQ